MLIYIYAYFYTLPLSFIYEFIVLFHILLDFVGLALLIVY